MKRNISIVYVNFSPYDNAGRILDYLISNYKTVVHFSYDHLRLKNGRNTNILTIYSDKKIVLHKELMTTRAPRFLLFPSLPIVAISIIFQTLWHTYTLKKIYGKFNIFFTVNGFPACIGILSKKLSLVNKIVYWVWDYYPSGSPSLRIRLLRSTYWFFDKYATSYSDRLVFPNKRLEQLRKQIGLLRQNLKSPLVPIGTTINYKLKPRKRNPSSLVLGHLGMLKWEQGLDFIFDNLTELIRKYPKFRLEIIGSGPEEDRFRMLAKQYKEHVVFHGFIEDDDEVNRVIRSWTIALATYVPDISNPSYWTDPSKIKRYLSQGIPTIATSVPDLAKEIHNRKAGVVITYGDKQGLFAAINKTEKSLFRYSKNALEMAQAYDYKKLYGIIFSSKTP